MIASTNETGIRFQTNKAVKAQVIAWEDLPRVIALLQNCAKQRAEDLRISAEAAKDLAKALEKVA